MLHKQVSTCDAASLGRYTGTHLTCQRPQVMWLFHEHDEEPRHACTHACRFRFEGPTALSYLTRVKIFPITVTPRAASTLSYRKDFGRTVHVIFYAMQPRGDGRVGFLRNYAVIAHVHCCTHVYTHLQRGDYLVGTEYGCIEKSIRSAQNRRCCLCHYRYVCTCSMQGPNRHDFLVFSVCV